MPAGGRRATLSLLALGGLLLTPGALGVPVTGDIYLRGALTLPPGAEATANPVGLIYNDAANISRLNLESPRLNVCQFETTYTLVGVSDPILAIPAEPKSTCFPMHDARASLQTTKNGWIGLNTNPSGSLVASGSGKVAPSSLPALASANVNDAGTADRPENAWFYRPLPSSHILWSGVGTATYTGPGSAKFLGPTLHIQTPDNSTACETGSRPAGSAQRLVRWCRIEWETATLTLETSTPFDFAAKNVGPLMWDGTARLERAMGELRTETRNYEANDAPATLDGRFTVTLEPRKDAARLSLEGDLRSTSLSPSSRAPTAASSSGPSWLPWIVAGAVVVGAAGGAAFTFSLARQRHARRVESMLLPLTVEDCKEAAQAAVNEENYPRALEWYARARKLAPHSAFLASQEAFCLGMVGRNAEALARYAEADRLSFDDGEAALNAARFLRDTAGDERQIENWLGRALEKSPQLAYELETDFPDLAQQPMWALRLREARARYEGEWTGRTPR